MVAEPRSWLLIFALMWVFAGFGMRRGVGVRQASDKGPTGIDREKPWIYLSY